LEHRSRLRRSHTNSIASLRIRFRSTQKRVASSNEARREIRPDGEQLRDDLRMPPDRCAERLERHRSTSVKARESAILAHRGIQGFINAMQKGEKQSRPVLGSVTDQIPRHSDVFESLPGVPLVKQTVRYELNKV
jgi:hypothetical protein